MRDWKYKKIIITKTKKGSTQEKEDKWRISIWRKKASGKTKCVGTEYKGWKFVENWEIKRA